MEAVTVNDNKSTLKKKSPSFWLVFLSNIKSELAAENLLALPENLGESEGDWCSLEAGEAQRVVRTDGLFPCNPWNSLTSLISEISTVKNDILYHWQKTQNDLQIFPNSYQSQILPMFHLKGLFQFWKVTSKWTGQQQQKTKKWQMIHLFRLI